MNSASLDRRRFDTVLDKPLVHRVDIIDHEIERRALAFRDGVLGLVEYQMRAAAQFKDRKIVAFEDLAHPMADEEVIRVWDI